MRLCCCCNSASSKVSLFASIAGALAIVFLAAVDVDGGDHGKAAPSQHTVLDRTMTTIDGEDVSLLDYQGDVVLIVNTASKCGLTPQYEGLEALYEANKGKGFVVLGFPANNFAGQEPGSDTEIAEFCTRNYGVTFPMFSKISVKGEDIDPLYEELTSMAPPIGGEVQWNFQKYLIDRQGQVVAMFPPRTKPDDPKLVASVEALLSSPAP